jgi:hypothetical protein
MEPEGSLPHSQDLATCPSPGPPQHEALRPPSLSISTVIIFIKKCMWLFCIRTRSSLGRTSKKYIVWMRKKTQKIIWGFHSDFDTETFCLPGRNIFICDKSTSALQRSLLHEVPPKLRHNYTTRLRAVTFQLIAFFKRRGIWWRRRLWSRYGMEEFRMKERRRKMNKRQRKR